MDCVNNKYVATPHLTIQFLVTYPTPMYNRKYLKKKLKKLNELKKCKILIFSFLRAHI